MRTLLTLLVCTIFIVSINAQSIIEEYYLTVSEKSFLEIENGTSLIFEENGYLQFEPLVFEDGFDLFDKSHNVLYIENLYVYDEAYEFQFFLTNLFLKLRDSSSKISYVITGDKGSRKIIVEYLNVGIDDEEFEDNNAYINAQIIIHEGTDVIEFQVGDSSIPTELYEFGGPVIGIVETHDEFGEGISYAYTALLNGPHDQPTLDYNIYNLDLAIDSLPHLDRLPDSGIKYTFARGEVKTKDLIYSYDLTYPNPVVNVLNIRYEAMPNYSDMIIYNASGSIVLKHNVSDKIDVSQFPQGVYTFELIGDESAIRSRFVKI